MKSLDLFARAFVAVLLVAFALPAGAASPEKIYSLNVSAFGVAPVAVTMKNETPTGNSTINSFIIKPPGGVSVTIASPASSSPATVTKDPATGWIHVNGFTGLKASDRSPNTITIKLNATYGAAACGASYAWTAKVFAGNSFAQEEFNPVIGTTPPTNAIQSTSCKFSLTMAPSSRVAGTSTTLTATLKNENAAGGPSITSATLAAPANFAITSVTAPGGTTATSTSNSVNVSATSIAPGATLVLNLAVNALCSPPAGNWGTTASGAVGAFGLVAASSSLGTAITGTCSLGFQAPPQNIAAGVPFNPPVVVALTGGSGPVPWFSGPVTLTTGTCAAGPVIATTSAVSGVASFASSVTLATPGNYTLTACSAFGSVGSSPFTVFAGTLACQPQLPFTFASLPTGVDDISDAGYAAGKRGQYNKDGAACVPVEYTFTNNILDFPLQIPPKPQQVSLVWNTAGNQKGAAFEYTATWNDEPVDATTLLPVTGKTKVSWQSDINGPIFVTGQTCLSPNLPSPYGDLGGTGLPNSTRGTTHSVTVANAIGLPSVGTTFPIMIGSERMSATRTLAGLDVVRGDGLTPDASTTVVPAHLSGAKIMSTPLPIDPASSKQAQMCIKAEVWVAVGACTPNPALPCVRFSTTVFDIGDGLMIR